MDKNMLNFQGIPMGTIVAFMLQKEMIPDGWLLCDGSEIPGQYSSLRTALNSAYTPNLSGRVLVSAGVGLAPWNSNYKLGGAGGTEQHTLSIAEMPAHNHVLRHPNEMDEDQGWPRSGFNSVWSSDRVGSSGSGPMLNTGGNQAHNNMQPYFVVNYIIYTGLNGSNPNYHKPGWY